MGQKVNPHGARVGVIIDWSTKWYAGKKDFSNNLIEDYNLRKMLKEKLNQAGISHIDLQRAGEKLHVIVYTAKPGIVIGKGGAGVEALKKEIEDFTGKQIALDIIEIKNPDIDAQLVAENIAQQLEKRVSFRRAMKQTIGRAMKSGAKGIKTTVSGRLGGADIARTEGYHEGTIPLQTLRARHRLRLCRGEDHLRPYRREGVDLQGPGSPAEGQQGLQAGQRDEREHPQRRRQSPRWPQAL